MYVRAAKNRDELWLLDQIEALGVDEAAFRSRDYVIAIDEETNAKTGFGRIRLHKTDDEEYCELTSLGVLEEYRDGGVGAHIVERLVENASDQGFETIYAFEVGEGYLEQFGFGPIDADELPDALDDRFEEKRELVDGDAEPLRLEVEAFEMPAGKRDAFKQAGGEDDEPEVLETAEDFGIDPDTATYKYDTGR
ncbi:MAG: GNAT family N-acetyltransferase [Halobacteriales archaeon]|nr:GNAT family N-acetyltransferase [Halobacteriales archaeon]